MNSLELVCTEELAQTTHRLVEISRRAYLFASVETTMVVSTQDANGNGVVNVYVNGLLQEIPMEMMMFAKEAYEKTIKFARALHKKEIKPDERNG